MDNLTQEMEEMKTDILGISETHWSGCGVLKREKHLFIYSGGEESKNLKGYWTISERLVMCKIEAKPFNITIIQCYAPTTDHPEKEVEEFYSQIEEALKQTNSQDMLIILGDFNAKVGKNSNIHKYRKIWPWENK